MGQKALNLRDAVCRVYSGDTTPYYYVLKFLEGTLTLPTRRPRATEVAVLNQGKLDTNAHRVIETDQPLIDPVTASISAILTGDANASEGLDAMSSPFDSTTVAGDTWTTVSSLGSVDNGDGTSVALPVPADSHRAAYLRNLEVLVTNPDGSGDDYGVKLQGVFFGGLQVNLGNPYGTVEGEMEIYGAISRISSFTTGNESTD